jgi:hypothetical protein
MKKQYDHILSCIDDFHTKLYQKKRLKTELKEENEENNDDIVEVIMQVEPTVP